MIKEGLEKYIIEGKTLDNVWVYTNFKLLEECSKDEMRKNGYVPALDIEPDIEVNFDGQHFNYKMTLYGIYHYFAKDYEGLISEWNVLIDK